MKIEQFKESIKTLILILFVFIIGFAVGYWAKNKEYEDKLFLNAVEITELKESIDKLKQIKRIE